MSFRIFSCILVLLYARNCECDLLSMEDGFTIVRINAKYNEVNTVIVNDTTEYVLVYPQTTSIYPYRVTVWSDNAGQNYPILVVVRQERSVLSWQVPLQVESSYFTVNYSNTSRTLCHTHMDVINNMAYDQLQDYFNSANVTQGFVVSASTSDVANLTVNVLAAEENAFYVKRDDEYSVIVSPSQPRYVYYKFTESDSDSIIIEVDSEDDVCLTVSVQDSSCPIFDLNKDIQYSGKYATVNRKGAITILKSEFPGGFFLVFVAKGDNSDCSQDSSLIPLPRIVGIRSENQTSVLTFVIKDSISKEQYVVGAVVTLSVVAGFCLVAVVVTFAFFKWGRMATLLKLRDQTDGESVTDSTVTDSVIDYYLCKDQLCVKNLSTKPKRNKKKSFNYLYHITNIALFYSIPVVQLVVTYQRIVNHSGDLDICYYNFLCAHPALGLSDFNHVYSNVGYIVIGTFFLGIILYRHSSIRPMMGCGIPVHYGFFYAMGVALIIEGLLSACYHICPSQSNYQFDLSFMYIMAVLILVKLYHNRHPDVNASAYTTFTIIGVGIFSAMIGILNGSLWIWLLFMVLYVFFCIYISFKIYFLSFVLTGLRKFKNDLKDLGFSRATFSPVKRARFILLLIANMLNYTILAVGFYSYYTGSTDFGTFLLVILMANAVLHATFYISMKLLHKESVCMEATIFGVAAMVTWGISSYFFLDYSTLWTLTPAESRQKNQYCSVLSFYDSHDIWHLISSAAMFLTYMFLLTLDDDLVTKPQEEIPVF